ncbi:iron uptake porin [Tumidithrix elongata RA019]|uniref:Iron uptake porin n=1 Tax=Tumidithrix elongata BACA0141 TaxID=2716417 RepID=A0AAW9Q3F1_9CYAN|nr:iron uptake porin [Tumidithrix elongata RA019]
MTKQTKTNLKLPVSQLAVMAAMAASTMMVSAAGAEVNTKTSQPVKTDATALTVETRLQVAVPQQVAQTVPTESSVIRKIGTDPIVRSGDARTAQNVTSVSQLSDVRPTDWAFTALQSLVERYGCIAGYPDRTYRGQRALSRYEFAAGLNACLDKINEIISAGLADKVSKEDLAAVQKLQEEFAAELATLRGRVDALEAKTTKLEAQQFSTTTKLNGEVIFAFAGATDGNANNAGAPTPNDKSNVIFGYRARLNFDTSFTGKDLLRTRLQASSLPSSTFPGALGSGNSSRLSFDGFVNGATTSGGFELGKLFYRFPIGDNTRVTLGPVVALDDVLDTLSPSWSDGQGFISRFARYSPLLRITNPQAIAAIDFKVGQGNIQLFYGANDPANPVGTVAGGAGSSGLFGGSTTAGIQLVWRPAEALDLGIGYSNSYLQTNSLGTGLNADSISGIGALQPIRANTVAGNLVWRLSKNIAFNTWGALVFTDAVNTNASTTFTSWLAAFSFKDLFSSGDTAAIAFGQPLYRNSVGGGANQGAGNVTTPYHLEAFYNFYVSKNISITPGVFFVFNPNSDSNNGTATVGVVRTTFRF